MSVLRYTQRVREPLVAADSPARSYCPRTLKRGWQGFTELVATAVANVQARGELSRFAEEQAALGRWRR
jgi:hypothetical protein